MEIAAYQIRLVKPSLIISHSELLSIAANAAEQCGVPFGSLVILGDEHELPPKASQRDWTIENLIHFGSSCPAFTEYSLAPGEAKAKIAFLCFSSGTTGPPKVK